MIGIRVLKLLAPIISTAGFVFTTGRNTQYGPKHLVIMLAAMARDNLTAESVSLQLESDKHRMPCGKWLRNMLNRLSGVDAEKLCNSLMERSVQMALESGMASAGALLIAIDLHLIPRYDKILWHLILSKVKNGTNKFECYSTMQAVGGKINAILDCVPIVKGDTAAEFMRRFMATLKKYKIPTRLLLVDRGFFSVDVMNVINEAKFKFLMPAIKNERIKAAIREYVAGKRSAVSKFTMKNKDGSECTFTLVIRPSKKKSKPDDTIYDKHIVFATNLSVSRARKEIDRLPKLYKARWGIETGYRQVEEIRGWTTSHNHLFRHVLFYISMFEHNIWAIARRASDSPVKRMTLRYVMTALIRVLKKFIIAGMPFDPGGMV